MPLNLVGKVQYLRDMLLSGHSPGKHEIVVQDKAVEQQRWKSSPSDT